MLTGAPCPALITSLIGCSAFTTWPLASTRTSPALRPAVAAGRFATASSIFCVFGDMPQPSSTTNTNTIAVR